MTIVTTVNTDIVTGITSVDLRGHLDLSSVPTVRSTLLKCLAQSPTAIVINLADLTADSRTFLAVFAAAARTQSHEDIPTALILHSAEPRVAALLDSRVLGTVAVYGSRAEALDAVTTGIPVSHRQADGRYAPTVAAPAAARDLVERACKSWEIEHLIEPATMIMSEFVSNAVQHAGTPIDVTLVLRGSYLHLRVNDSDPRPPTPRELDMYAPGPLTERGRGLYLVDIYASAWGSSPTPTGKTVWATLRAVPV
jgi:anti-anti-sigma factor